MKNEPLYKQREAEILKSRVSPLVPRDTFFCGRTITCKLFARVIRPGDENSVL